MNCLKGEEDEACWEVGGEVLGGRFSVTYYPLQGAQNTEYSLISIEQVKRCTPVLLMPCMSVTCCLAHPLFYAWLFFAEKHPSL